MHGLLFRPVVFLDGFVGKYFFCKGEISFLVLLHVPSLHLTLIWNWGMVVWGEWEGLMFFEG